MRQDFIRAVCPVFLSSSFFRGICEVEGKSLLARRSLNFVPRGIAAGWLAWPRYRLTIFLRRLRPTREYFTTANHRYRAGKWCQFVLRESINAPRPIASIRFLLFLVVARSLLEETRFLSAFAELSAPSSTV